jgi:hypothetical protein
MKTEEGMRYEFQLEGLRPTIHFLCFWVGLSCFLILSIPAVIICIDSVRFFPVQYLGSDSGSKGRTQFKSFPVEFDSIHIWKLHMQFLAPASWQRQRQLGPMPSRQSSTSRWAIGSSLGRITAYNSNLPLQSASTRVTSVPHQQIKK